MNFAELVTSLTAAAEQISFDRSVKLSKVLGYSWKNSSDTANIMENLFSCCENLSNICTKLAMVIFR